MRCSCNVFVEGLFRHRISVVSNAIQTVTNEVSHLIAYHPFDATKVRRLKRALVAELLITDQSFRL